MSINTLIRKCFMSVSDIHILFGYYDTWKNSSSPIVRRNAIRCRAQAVVHMDRNEDLRNGL